MSSSVFRFARHSPAVAAIVTSSWSFGSNSKCDAPDAEEKPSTPSFGMNPETKGDFHNLFPRRQLWQPKQEYPWWDKDWDGKSPARSGDDEADRKQMRKLRKEGVTRHIILVRHGQYDETEQEDAKRTLTEVGRKQADITGKRLREMLDGANEEFGPCRIKAVRVSNMTRAKETADIIASHLPGVERPLPDPELNEGRPAHNVPGGKASSSTIKKTDESHPRIEKAYLKYFYRADPPSEEEVGDSDRPKHEFEIIVCHANVIRYFFCRALQLPPEAWLRLCTFNCSLTYLTIRPTGTVSARMLGDVGHIPYGLTTFSMHPGFNCLVSHKLAFRLTKIDSFDWMKDEEQTKEQTENFVDEQTHQGSHNLLSTHILLPAVPSADTTMQAPSMSTRFTRLFGCRYPILLPGMSWISNPELVASVSNAGGVGILATGPLTAEETRNSIRRIRSLTDKPFGIGATLLMPGAKENAKVALEEQVPIINVSLGKATWIADGLAQYGGKMIATVTNQKHAVGALEAGADALMVTGHEAAAHGGDVTSLVLIPSFRKNFPDTPIVAAGGFATGSGLAGALALGADGVAMGSRMAVTRESPLAEATKLAIVSSDESETLFGSKFDGIPARVLKTPRSEEAMKQRPSFPVVAYRAFQAAQQVGIPMYKVLPGLLTQFEKMFVIAQFGAATEAIQAATVKGDLESGVQFVGQSQGLIDDIPNVNDLVQRVVYEARQVHEDQATLYGEDDFISKKISSM